VVCLRYDLVAPAAPGCPLAALSSSQYNSGMPIGWFSSVGNAAARLPTDDHGVPAGVADERACTEYLNQPDRHAAVVLATTTTQPAGIRAPQAPPGHIADRPLVRVSRGLRGRAVTRRGAGGGRGLARRGPLRRGLARRLRSRRRRLGGAAVIVGARLGRRLGRRRLSASPCGRPPSGGRHRTRPPSDGRHRTSQAWPRGLRRCLRAALAEPAPVRRWLPVRARQPPVRPRCDYGHGLDRWRRERDRRLERAVPRGGLFECTLRLRGIRVTRAGLLADYRFPDGENELRP